MDTRLTTASGLLALAMRALDCCEGGGAAAAAAAGPGARLTVRASAFLGRKVLALRNCWDSWKL